MLTAKRGGGIAALRRVGYLSIIRICMYIKIRRPSWRRAGGREVNNLIPYHLTFLLHRPYYCTNVLQHCCTTVKTVRPYDVSDDDRRPNVDSISREVRGIVSRANRTANFSSFLTWASPTLIYYICIVRCKKSTCSEPAQRNGQGASSM